MMTVDNLYTLSRPVRVNFISLLLLLATIGLALSSPLATQAGAEELRGKIIEVEGRLVRIVIESDMWPMVGDTLRFGQTMPGFDELIFMAGEWTVTKVTPEYVKVEAGAGVTSTPGRSYVAIIRSTNPQPRPVEETGGAGKGVVSGGSGKSDTGGQGMEPIDLEEASRIYGDLLRVLEKNE